MIDSKIAAVLKSLQPPRSDRRGAPVAGFNVSDIITERSCEEVSGWLGFPLPTFPASLVGDRKRICATDVSGEIPAYGSTLPNGEQKAVTAYVLYAPPALDLRTVSVEEAPAAGLLVFMAQTGQDKWKPTVPETKVDGAAGGYTAVTVRGTTVGVQNSGANVTRFAWIKSVQGRQYDITLLVPQDVMNAATSLLGSTGTP